ncbi:MAG: hypothetical protein IPI41_08030 [Flavobacteriales bacterium]|nr:hypothetical protein [Flavobacteriales bacterium]
MSQAQQQPDMRADAHDQHAFGEENAAHQARGGAHAMSVRMSCVLLDHHHGERGDDVERTDEPMKLSTANVNHFSVAFVRYINAFFS